MSVGDEVFRRLQSAARSAAAKAGTGAPTQEYLIRHTLESFLDRLTRTAHAEDFVLKGGILLAAYGVRRPTRDADANAVGADVTADHLVAAAHDIAGVETDDGVVFDLDRSACRRSASTPTTHSPQPAGRLRHAIRPHERPRQTTRQPSTHRRHRDQRRRKGDDPTR